ncbi:MAG: Permease YjgP/YjgQ family protein [Pedosphaera sp.]|nr:Permease YjgP/YjgQ family protein [Pedosphaera sp.]
MKTLHFYLTRQVLATLVMTVAVFTLVLLLGNILKEILVLLISRQATLGLVIQAIGLLIPWVLAFALPMGMLTAALLVFGRFSADQELTAVRSSGISLVALVSPILLLSLLLCGVSALVNMEIAPRCRVAYQNLLRRASAKIMAAAVPEGRFITIPRSKQSPGYILYVGKTDGNELSDVQIYTLDDEEKVESITLAPRGKIYTLDPQTTNQQTFLHLEDLRQEKRDGDKWIPFMANASEYPLSIKQTTLSDGKPGVSDMTFHQLRVQLRELEQHFSEPDSHRLSSEELANILQIIRQQKEDMTMSIRVQMHRQVAFSFACFGFTLIGIPLGIRAHRRETNVGIAMALILVTIYYSFVLLGLSLQTHPEWAPHLIIWLPNFIFQAIGAVMLWRANRGI